MLNDDKTYFLQFLTKTDHEINMQVLFRNRKITTTQSLRFLGLTLPLLGNVILVTRSRYVVKHNLITEVYLMTVMETTTCFGPCWPSSGCLGNVEISTPRAHACI